MTRFGFPQQSTHQKTGRAGEAFFEYFVTNILGWIYRPVHQESDFGVDGYIDIVKDGNVTGKSIAVQIKCGNSYISKKSKGGIKYEGKNKHLNYYLNLHIPVILIALNDDFSRVFWVLFDIERTTESKSGWWIEIPRKNELDSTVKDLFSRIAGDSEDYSEEIQSLWATNKALSEASLLVFAVPKSEVVSGDLSTLVALVKKLTKNKEMTISKRSSAEIFFPEYDFDPRELYQIPEVRQWFRKTIDEEFPWFYFLNHDKGIGLTLLYCCACKVSFQGIYDNKHSLQLDPDETDWWLEQNFMNLNQFVEANGIAEEINREISDGIKNWWFKKFISGDAANSTTN
jgi:hypothetical protein